MSHLWHGGPQGQTPFKVGDMIEVAGNKEDGYHTITAVYIIPALGNYYTYATTYSKKSPMTGEIVTMIRQVPHTKATKVSRRNRKSSRKNGRRSSRKSNRR